MSQKRFQSHWKEMVAEQEVLKARRAKAAEPEIEPEEDEEEDFEEQPSWQQVARDHLHRYRHYWLAGSLALLAICLAITLAPDIRPRRVYVSGRVLVDGVPLTNGVVSFLPDGARPSLGTLDEHGQFTLTCYDGDDGVVPGRHRVEITPARAPAEGEPPWPVPQSYASYESSGLEFDISGPSKDLLIEIVVKGEQPLTETDPESAPDQDPGPVGEVD